MQPSSSLSSRCRRHRLTSCRAAAPIRQFRNRRGDFLQKTRPEAISVPLPQVPLLEGTLQTVYNMLLEKKRELGAGLQGKLPYLCATMVAAGGVTLGLNTSHDPTLPTSIATLSSILGWSYFISWSLSFYPQAFENWHRQSVQGLSLDYVVYSLVGFTSYATFASFMSLSPDMQAAYAAVHQGQQVQIGTQDLLFAFHALSITLAILAQFRFYGTPASLQLSAPCKALLAVLGASTVSFLAYHTSLVAEPEAQAMAGLGFLYLLSYVKLAMTITSYVPQVLLNCRRRSTAGWNMGTVYLDLAGGLLCNSQLLLECTARGDWALLSSNPVKSCLGCISILFDAIFLLQHFVFFRAAWDSAAPTPRATPATSKP